MRLLRSQALKWYWPWNSLHLRGMSGIAVGQLRCGPKWFYTSLTRLNFLTGSWQVAAREAGHKISLSAWVLRLLVSIRISRSDLVPDRTCKVLFPGVPRRPIHRLCILQVLDWRINLQQGLNSSWYSWNQWQWYKGGTQSPKWSKARGIPQNGHWSWISRPLRVHGRHIQLLGDPTNLVCIS